MSRNTAKTTDPIWDSRNSDEPKVADEHQTGVWVWKGQRVTEAQWRKLKNDYETRNPAAVRRPSC